MSPLPLERGGAGWVGSGQISESDLSKLVSPLPLERGGAGWVGSGQISESVLSKLVSPLPLERGGAGGVGSGQINMHPCLSKRLGLGLWTIHRLPALSMAP